MGPRRSRKSHSSKSQAKRKLHLLDRYGQRSQRFVMHQKHHRAIPKAIKMRTKWVICSLVNLHSWLENGPGLSRCISYWKWGYSIAILVYQRVSSLVLSSNLTFWYVICFAAYCWQGINTSPYPCQKNLESIVNREGRNFEILFPWEDSFDSLGLLAESDACGLHPSKEV